MTHILCPLSLPFLPSRHRLHTICDSPPARLFTSTAQTGDNDTPRYPAIPATSTTQPPLQRCVCILLSNGQGLPRSIPALCNDRTRASHRRNTFAREVLRTYADPCLAADALTVEGFASAYIQSKKKYKPVAQKVRAVLRKCPEQFCIERNITGDPLATIPTLHPHALPDASAVHTNWVLHPGT